MRRLTFELNGLRGFSRRSGEVMGWAYSGLSVTCQAKQFANRSGMPDAFCFTHSATSLVSKIVAAPLHTASGLAPLIGFLE